jgi:PadR family transcriptional regulator, regulatory protein AphA
VAEELTTTSYAILGLLAVKPWTTYELARQMKRAVGQFWPRAESNLYAEPKKLVALGLATASQEMVGNRPRTLYTITPDGREALAGWIPRPASGPVLEWETLLKVFFAEHGSKDDLLAAIEDARTWTERQLASTLEIPRGYLQGQGPFPERLAWILLSGQFLKEFTLAVGRWAEWATEVVEAWPDDIRDAEPNWAALEAMAVDADDYLRRAAERRRQGSEAAGATGPTVAGPRAVATPLGAASPTDT